MLITHMHTKLHCSLLKSAESVVVSSTNALGQTNQLHSDSIIPCRLILREDYHSYKEFPEMLQTCTSSSSKTCLDRDQKQKKEQNGQPMKSAELWHVKVPIKTTRLGFKLGSLYQDLQAEHIEALGSSGRESRVSSCAFFFFCSWRCGGGGGRSAGI